ncbi:MAG: hypothetical protein Q8P41_04030 [Pseudomonadota bacterium]|nr:hypothetical protein [Pseudomonadota bacterium]
MKRLVLILLALPTFASAQETAPEIDEASGRQIIRQKAQEVDFDEVDVNAALNRPSFGYVAEARRETFNPLIRLRLDFNTEMDASVGDVK